MHTCIHSCVSSPCHYLQLYNIFIHVLLQLNKFLLFSRSLYINLLGLLSILLCSVFAGMCLFSVYKDCDPWTAGLVSAPDQVQYRKASHGMALSFGHQCVYRTHIRVYTLKKKKKRIVLGLKILISAFLCATKMVQLKAWLENHFLSLVSIKPLTPF